MDLGLKISKQIDAGINRRDKAFVKQKFDSHSNKHNGLIMVSCIEPALIELGIDCQLTEIEEIFMSRGLNIDAGLDFQEFFSFVNTPSPVEEWVRSLPLSQLVADAMPTEDRSHRKDPLRYLSSISPDQLTISCEEIKKYLMKILQEQLAVLRKAFENLDRHVTADSNKKFQIENMSFGNVDDFHEGLATRIGKLRC